MLHGIGVSTINISAPDTDALAAFYARLLGWELVAREPGWAMIAGAEEVRISFEYDAAYQRPTWPSRPDQPPMMMHLEIRVTDLDGALAHALDCGAVLAGTQPQPDVRVCLDPAGHPFCLWLDETP